MPTSHPPLSPSAAGRMPGAISAANLRLLEINRLRHERFRTDIAAYLPWWRRCDVNVLIVTDGSLNFGEGDFGLSTFIRTLLDDAPSRVNFRLTLAHLRGSADMLSAEPRIVARVNDFRFDEAAHFAPDKYDEVWLFGIETSFANGGYTTRQANPARYPATRLNDDELRAIGAHMNRGGGVFATGDHGALGKALCGEITRVRSMRWWDHYSPSPGADSEVSMSGPRRNDTNRTGHDAGWQFSDQSDDVPQVIDLKLYSTPLNVLRLARYPHPVLCGRTGRINVLPDHAHEGECKVPADLNLPYAPDGSREYPFASGTSTPISPEIIAHARVPAGNGGTFVTANGQGVFKQATEAHSFPVISAYDGHRAGVGRIICDATWHHFINVNLVGVVEGGGFDEFDTNAAESWTKHDGFLSTASGRTALDKIRNYYTNIGVWIAPTGRHQCFNQWIWWELVFSDRLMEAALTSPDIPLERIPVDVFHSIGVHARDVFGRRASHCQTVQWVIDFISPIWPEIKFWIDPWDPLREAPSPQPPLPTLDVMPLVDAAVGAALVALRQAMPYPPEKLTPKHDKLAGTALAKGAAVGLKAAVASHLALQKQMTKVMQLP